MITLWVTLILFSLLVFALIENQFIKKKKRAERSAQREKNRRSYLTGEHRWGHNISWFDWEKRKVMGHMETMPQIGDYLVTKR
jgi:hypothetical protein